nr:unnamed protein product [Spirometra erinaceieuropaei]
MALSCGTKLIKYLLFIFNTVVFILGAIIIGFGIYFVVEANKDFNGQGIGVPVFVLVLGLVVFLLGFLGCFGAWKEHACMLKTFAAIIIVLVILQIIACILVFVYTGKFVTLAADAIATQIKELDQLPAVERNQTLEVIDHMQKQLECCGGHGPADWGTTYPPSCCGEESKTCKKPYQQGCAKTIYEIIKVQSMTVGIIIAVMAIVQLGAIIAACCLAKKIGEYEKV